VPEAALVVAVIPPGRFPTVIHDIGPWRQAVDGRSLHLRREGLNAAYWRAKVGQLGGPGGADQFARLHLEETYRSPSAYLSAISPLSTAIRQSALQSSEYLLSPTHGPVAKDVDYQSASALVRYAKESTQLSSEVDALTSQMELPKAPLIMLCATSAFDLLTALMVAVLIRRRRPGAHLCLAEHSYENFSLRQHFERFGRASPVLEIVDSVLPSLQSQAQDAGRLLDALFPRGSSGHGDGSSESGIVGDLHTSERRLTLAPPIAWSRLDDGTCWWGLCTFCVQNDKADNRKSDPLKAIVRARRRIDELSASGARHVVFSDEALHPLILDAVADRMGCEGINWCARVKLDRRIDDELLCRIAATGGIELLVGLESAVPRIQTAMRKYNHHELTAAGSLFCRFARAKVALHLNLIAAFPSERPREFMQTWALARQILGEAHLPTFSLNVFTLFNGSPIADDPAAFGLRDAEPDGDLLVTMRYRLRKSDARRARSVRRLVDRCEGDLARVIGLPRADRDSVSGLAGELFMTTGHGLLLKANGIGARDLNESSMLRELETA
jgi:hypothetical protein